MGEIGLFKSFFFLGIWRGAKNFLWGLNDVGFFYFFFPTNSPFLFQRFFRSFWGDTFPKLYWFAFHQNSKQT